jgi:flagellar biogenesis protein FliO
MFSNTLIAFLASIGFAAWVYSKVQRSTGGNTSNSLLVAGGSGLLLFLFLVIVLGLVF